MGQVLKFPSPDTSMAACSGKTIAARLEHRLQAMVRDLEMALVLNEFDRKLHGRLKEAGVLMTEARLVLRHVDK